MPIEVNPNCFCCPQSGSGSGSGGDSGSGSGAGWYCIDDTYYVRQVVFLTAEDLIDPDFTIISGPFATEHEASLACDGETCQEAITISLEETISDSGPGPQYRSRWYTIGGLTPNTVYYFYWDYTDTDGSFPADNTFFNLARDCDTGFFYSSLVKGCHSVNIGATDTLKIQMSTGNFAIETAWELTVSETPCP